MEQGFEKKRPRDHEGISFSEKDFDNITWPYDDPVVLHLKIDKYKVKRVIVDTSSSVDILYLSAFKKMGFHFNRLQRITTPLIGFTRDILQPRGVVQLKVIFSTPLRVIETMVDFLVLSAPFAYNAILGRGILNKIGAIVSSPHLKIKFHIDHGVGEKRGQQQVARECYLTSIKGQGGEVHQVEARSGKKSHFSQPQMQPSKEFMPPNVSFALDPTDKVESKMCLELEDEVEQIALKKGKFLNIGKAIQG